jgi:hypothetical protein
MIVITIFGIIIIFGGNYFISVLQEHRISVQNYYLQREASFALDSIINGRMIEGDNGVFYRIDGIISSNNFEIKGNGEEIRLYNIDDVLLGRILTYPTNNTQLLFDEDEYDENGNEHRIIPRGSSEAAIKNPYVIGIRFTEERDNLINITLWLNQQLEQEANGRNLRVELNSAVRLRN